MEPNQPQVVVEAPARDGGRRVRAGTESLGIAYAVGDLLEFLRRAGLDPDDVDVEGPLIEWHGGGPQTWARDSHDAGDDPSGDR